MTLGNRGDRRTCGAALQRQRARGTRLKASMAAELAARSIVPLSPDLALRRRGHAYSDWRRGLFGVESKVEAYCDPVGVLAENVAAGYDVDIDAFVRHVP